VPVKAQLLGPTLPLPVWAKKVRQLLNYQQPVSGTLKKESYTTPCLNMFETILVFLNKREQTGL